LSENTNEIKILSPFLWGWNGVEYIPKAEHCTYNKDCNKRAIYISDSIFNAALFSGEDGAQHSEASTVSKRHIQKTSL
jgi:hypothetical protein